MHEQKHRLRLEARLPPHRFHDIAFESQLAILLTTRLQKLHQDSQSDILLQTLVREAIRPTLPLVSSQLLYSYNNDIDFYAMGQFGDSRFNASS